MILSPFYLLYLAFLCAYQIAGHLLNTVWIVCEESHDIVGGMAYIYQCWDNILASCAMYSKNARHIKLLILLGDPNDFTVALGSISNVENWKGLSRRSQHKIETVTEGLSRGEILMNYNEHRLKHALKMELHIGTSMKSSPILLAQQTSLKNEINKQSEGMYWDVVYMYHTSSPGASEMRLLWTVGEQLKKCWTEALIQDTFFNGNFIHMRIEKKTNLLPLNTQINCPHQNTSEFYVHYAQSSLHMTS